MNEATTNAVSDIERAIAEARLRNDPSERIVRLITTSPNSPAFKRVWRSLKDDDWSDVALRVVFTRLKKAEAVQVIEDIASKYGLSTAEANVRYSRLKNSSKIRELIQVGETGLWVDSGGDEKELSTRRVSAHLADEKTAEANEHFELIWDFSDPLPRSVVRKGGKRLEKSRKLSSVNLDGNKPTGRAYA